MTATPAGRTRSARLLTALGCCLLATGCSGNSAGGTTPRTTLTVLAAASLTESFTEIGAAYQATHPDVEITFSFGGSSTLAAQIVAGAPADVFAAASGKTMASVVDAKQAGTPTTFARNTLQIATPPGNPAGIHRLADLQRTSLTVVLCQAAVPCGAASRTALERAGVHVEPASEEADVKGVLTKVQLGEADAGIVYRTDVIAAGATVAPVTIPAAQNVTTSYPISTLAASHDPQAAQEFVAYVTSTEGQKILASKGFLTS